VNSGPLVFLGLFMAMACSWLSFVLGPQLQLGNTRPTTNIVVGGTGKTYPTAEPGTAHQGAEIYRAEGCAACHTEQVRPRSLGSDIDRGWGARRSIAYDYLYDHPVMLGSLRVGPDLANAGRRLVMTEILKRLYEPRAVTTGSIMPPYPFLFEKRKYSGHRSEEALQLDLPYAPAEGYEIVPKPEALALAAYVLNLHQDGYLFEAPPPPAPPKKTNTPPTTVPAPAPEK
jgi:cytochrome c oxidase cbb3-type subunit II